MIRPAIMQGHRSGQPGDQVGQSRSRTRTLDPRRGQGDEFNFNELETIALPTLSYRPEWDLISPYVYPPDPEPEPDNLSLSLSNRSGRGRDSLALPNRPLEGDTLSCRAPSYHSAVEPEEIQVAQLEVTQSQQESPVVSPQSNTVTVVDDKKSKHVEYTCLAALMWSMFINGWQDGTSGPMIPAIQKSYHIGFAIVSLIFVVNSIGFISAAIVNITLSQKVGFGKTLVIGALSQLTAFCLQSIGPPFPAFVFAYFFAGFGFSLLLAQGMDFAVSLNKDASTKMAILHASYGTGALISPLVATQFASMRQWSFHFLVSLGCSITNVAALSLVFKFRELNDVLQRAGQMVRQTASSTGNNANHYSQLLKLKIVHILAIFILAYVGVEVTLGGWIVTFVIDERNGGPSSGYISSGFFAGLTVGRLGLLWINGLIGERRVIWLYILLSIGLEVTVWLVPSLVANAVAVSFIGLFLGPIYPIVMSLTGRFVPHWLMSGAVGWIAGLGQAGSAILPFITGTMASKFGVSSLQPLIVTVLGIMIGLWAVVPPDQQRSD